MSNTYLIFFGKSQDFAFHAFDNESYISDFDRVIKDFDELESKFFTTDDHSDKQILSKYTFSKNLKKYSLLKLYSFAQAYDSARISGSIYGVGLLSDRDITISETNLDILKAAKEAFAGSALVGLKFKSSNFFLDAEKIWKALIHHKDGNYLDKIDYSSIKGRQTNNEIRAYFVADIFKDSLGLVNGTASRIYISDDITHLKKTQERWGKEIFPIYYADNILYKEKVPEKTTPEPGLKPASEISGLKSENEVLKITLETEKKKTKRLERTKRILFTICSTVLALGLGYWIDQNFGGPSKPPPGAKPAETTPPEQKNIIKTEVPDPNKDSLINVIEIISSVGKQTALKNLMYNINTYEDKRQTTPSYVSQQVYEAIIRDAEKLGLKTTFFDKYKPD